MIYRTTIMLNRASAKVFAVGLMLTGMTYGVLGCLSPPGEVPLCHIIQNTKAIFSGEVMEIRPQLDESSSATQKSVLEQSYTPQYNRVRFLVTDNFKNVSVTSLEILALKKHITSCDEVHDFKIGEKWLIFANQNQRSGIDYIVTKASKVDDSTVTRTLVGLHQNRERGIDSGIFGQFLMNHPLSLVSTKGLPVTATIGDEMQTARMDEFGQYAFPILSPGKYKVRVFLPYDGHVLDDERRPSSFSYDNGSKLNFYEFDATVKESECFYQTTRAFPPIQN